MLKRLGFKLEIQVFITQQAFIERKIASEQTVSGRASQRAVFVVIKLLFSGNTAFNTNKIPLQFSGDFFLIVRNMTLEFGSINRKELRQAAELASRAFSDYEYFTNWFPDDEERARVEIAIIWHSYKSNFKRVHPLSAKLNGKIVATAELSDPDYKDPSVLSYVLHGWLNVYKAADKKSIDDWIAMDAAAGEPCHDYQKTGPGIWYVSSLSVDPAMQGIGLGTQLLEYCENYIRERDGKQVVLVTNSQKNLNFYLKRGYELFDERVFEYNGHKMGSWSLKKVL